MGMFLTLISSIASSCLPCGQTSTPTTCIIDNTCNDNVSKFQLGDALLNGANTKAFRQDGIAYLAAYFNQNNNSTIGRRRFSVRDVYCVIEKYLKCKYNSSISFYLVEIIYKHFRGDITKIVIFFTHIIHNTSGFKYFVGTDPCHYNGDVYSVARGILQIIGKQNYELAGYVNEPTNLALLNERSVCASLRVYDIIVGQAACYLCDSWLKLKPCEVIGQNYLYEGYQARISNRLTIYTDLVAMFCIRPSFSTGGTCYFLKAYRPQIQERCGVIVCATPSPLY